MRIPLVLCLSLLAAPALADTSRTILVLDASGSMWGQIDGETKIEIARRAVGDLLDTAPADVEMGLTAYGHRRKGDCADIETLVPVGAGSRPAIRAAIDAIRPKGKTPLSDAVLAAAEELKYSEEKATVILVSDGRETCQADPCAVGKQLEETGVDFTAHVVGFDISEEEDEAQLRCLAENTGGDFVLASDATELREALERVVTVPEPIAVEVTFGATARGRPAVADLIWTVTPEGGEPVLDHEPGSAPALELDPGEYAVEVLRTSDEAFGEATITVGPGEETRHVIALEIPLPKATLAAPETVSAGMPFTVDWTGPDAEADRIVIRNAEESRDVEYAYTRTGATVSLVAPGEPGTYRIGYLLAGERVILSEVPLTVTEAEVGLTAPETLSAGTPFTVDWTGPGAQADRIVIRDTESGRDVGYAYTRTGTTVELVAPGKPGAYIVGYLAAADREILSEVALTVTEAEVGLTAPETVSAGMPFTVDWTGPDAQADRIVVTKGSGRALTYAYTRDGAAALVAPVEPGTYRVGYLAAADRVVLSDVPLTVTEAEIELTVPEAVGAGQPFTVDWTGPDAPSDRIEVIDANGRTASYDYTRDGATLTLTAPEEPGEYGLRYLSGTYRTSLHDVMLTVVPPEAVSAPEPEAAPAPAAEAPKEETSAESGAGTPAPAGAIETAEEAVTLDLLNDPVSVGTTATVLWTGPAGEDDGIAIAPTGSGDDAALAFAPVADGNPVELPLPSRSGGYELRYIDGEGVILARSPFTLYSEPQ